MRGVLFTTLLGLAVLGGPSVAFAGAPASRPFDATARPGTDSTSRRFSLFRSRTNAAATHAALGEAGASLSAATYATHAATTPKISERNLRAAFGTITGKDGRALAQRMKDLGFMRAHDAAWALDWGDTDKKLDAAEAKGRLGILVARDPKRDVWLLHSSSSGLAHLEFIAHARGGKSAVLDAKGLLEHGVSPEMIEHAIRGFSDGQLAIRVAHGAFAKGTTKLPGTVQPVPALTTSSESSSRSATSTADGMRSTLNEAASAVSSTLFEERPEYSREASKRDLRSTFNAVTGGHGTVIAQRMRELGYVTTSDVTHSGIAHSAGTLDAAKAKGKLGLLVASGSTSEVWITQYGGYLSFVSRSHDGKEVAILDLKELVDVHHVTAAMVQQALRDVTSGSASPTLATASKSSSFAERRQTKAETRSILKEAGVALTARAFEKRPELARPASERDLKPALEALGGERGTLLARKMATSGFADVSDLYRSHVNETARGKADAARANGKLGVFVTKSALGEVWIAHDGGRLHVVTIAPGRDGKPQIERAQLWKLVHDHHVTSELLNDALRSFSESALTARTELEPGSKGH